MNLLVKRSPIDAPDALEEVSFCIHCMSVIRVTDAIMDAVSAVQAWLSSFQAHKALLESDPPTAVIAALDAASASRASPSSNPRPAAPILEAVLFACLTWPLRQAVDLLNRLSGASSRAAVLSCIAIPFSKQFLAGKLCYATDAVRAQVQLGCHNSLCGRLLNSCERCRPFGSAKTSYPRMCKALRKLFLNCYEIARVCVIQRCRWAWVCFTLFPAPQVAILHRVTRDS
jgi:hypothetical protein